MFGYTSPKGSRMRLGALPAGGSWLAREKCVALRRPRRYAIHQRVAPATGVPHWPNWLGKTRLWKASGHYLVRMKCNWVKPKLVCGLKFAQWNKEQIVRSLARLLRCARQSRRSICAGRPVPRRSFALGPSSAERKSRARNAAGTTS